MKRAKTPMPNKGTVERRKKSDYHQLHSYIQKVLKQVHPDMGMTEASREMLNAFNIHMLEKITCEVHRLMMLNGNKTATARDVQTATRIVLPGELAKHAVREGTKAVTKLNDGQGKKGERMEAKCGLVFPVTRIRGMMKEHLHTAISATAPVYMTAVLEYLTAEVLELSGNGTRDDKKVRITPRWIMLSIHNDDELDKLTRNMAIPGGVLMNIRSELLPKN